MRGLTHIHTFKWLLFLAMICLAENSLAQVSPSLSITSPVANTVVQPGETIQVAVTATSPSLLTSESVLGTSPLPVLAERNAASQLTFSFAVPTRTHSGTYYITAVGALASGGLIYSDSVPISIPPAGPVSALKVSNSPLYFSTTGNQSTLDVQATTSVGAETLTSSQLSFVSSDPGIASVDANGTVTAQGPGKTQITVTYGGGSAVSAVIPVQVRSSIVRGDLNGDGRVDIDDANILDEWLNTPATGPNDARDLNHDGVINALDARILVTLCTYSHCATHP